MHTHFNVAIIKCTDRKRIIKIFRSDRVNCKCGNRPEISPFDNFFGGYFIRQLQALFKYLVRKSQVKAIVDEDRLHLQFVATEAPNTWTTSPDGDD